MKILIALFAIVAPCLASTHIHDATVVGPDGKTLIAAGRMVVQGYQRNANENTALTGTFTVPIVNGTVDFTVEGGANVHFQATVYLTTPDGKTVLSSYREPVWVVPDTIAVLKIKDIRGSELPTNLYLTAGSYCITVTPPTYAVVSCGSGILFDSAAGLFDSATGSFDAH